MTATAAAAFVDVDSHWTLRAPCRDVDAEIFFPTNEVGRRTTDTAKRICITCPLRRPCLDENYTEPFGVFGGLSEEDRAKLRRGGWRPGDKLPPVELKVKSRPAYREPGDTSYAEPDEAWARDAHRYAIEHGLPLAQIAKHVGVYPELLIKKFERYRLTGLPDGRKHRTAKSA